MDSQHCLQIVDNWIKTASREDKKKFFTLQDFIEDDLEYTHRADAILNMTKFLDSRKQDEDMIIVRKYINL